MIIAILGAAGLCLGSFVNALVWRVHEQSKHKDPSLSIGKGRSMCPHCRHELASKDLIPILSWLSLRGKCRYCHKAISVQYPLVELAMALLFIASYLWWPALFDTTQIAIFILWLALLTDLLALLVYDLRWFLLPDRLMLPLGGLAAAEALLVIAAASTPLTAFLNTVLAAMIGGGLFYLLFQVSDGKWIGGGDVKLGFILGLIAGTPVRSLLLIFLASFIGTLISLPLLLTHRLGRKSVVPFGPFLIMGIIVVQLFGADILNWYQQTFIMF